MSRTVESVAPARATRQARPPIGARELCLVGVTVLAVHVAKALTLLTPRQSDFVIFYESALRARLGYSMYFGDAAEFIRNHNPPHFHLVVLPFTSLPVWAAWVAWTALSAALALWLTRVVMRQSDRPWTSDERWILAACLLNAAGVQAALRTGQLSWLIAAMVTAAWIAVRRDQWVLAGVWTGLAISIKPFLLVLLAFYLVRQQWRALAIAIGVAMIGIASGAAFFGSQSLREWLAVLRTAPDPEYFRHFVNASIMGFLVRGGWPALAGSIVAAVLVLATVWRIRTADDDRAWALLLVAALLASPIACMYYAPLLLGPLVVLLHERRLRVSRWLLIPFMFPPIAQEPFRGALLQLSIGSIYLWGFVALWFALTSAPRRAARPAIAP